MDINNEIKPAPDKYYGVDLDAIKNLDLMYLTDHLENAFGCCIPKSHSKQGKIKYKSSNNGMHSEYWVELTISELSNLYKHVTNLCVKTKNQSWQRYNNQKYLNRLFQQRKSGEYNFNGEDFYDFAHATGWHWREDIKFDISYKDFSQQLTEDEFKALMRSCERWLSQCPRKPNKKKNPSNWGIYNFCRYITKRLLTWDEQQELTLNALKRIKKMDEDLHGKSSVEKQQEWLQGMWERCKRWLKENGQGHNLVVYNVGMKIQWTSDQITNEEKQRNQMQEDIYNDRLKY